MSNNLSPVEQILALLNARKETISCAESCTGGHLANLITSTAGVSSIFLGGVIAYANDAKEKLLSVPKKAIITHGSVSEEVAKYMARNCQTLFSSTWAISTTGIAGPSGGSAKKPVGTVWIGLAGPDLLQAKHYCFHDTSRLEHRQKTIETALSWLRECIKK